MINEGISNGTHISNTDTTLSYFKKFQDFLPHNFKDKLLIM